MNPIMLNSEAVFTLRDIKFKHVLDIPELKINEKNVTAIVGRSGSGKTTLLHLLNKMVTPDSGQIFFYGNDMAQIAPVELRREVVMMAQSPVIFDGNVRDNLLVGLRFSQKEMVSDKALLDVLQSVELNKKLDDSVLRMSGGEKQRLSLARVAVMKPRVLLLDEPSSALDNDTEDEVMDKIIQFGKQYNIVLIFVTHSTAMAEKYADEIIRIEKGSIHSIIPNHHAEPIRNY